MKERGLRKDDSKPTNKQTNKQTGKGFNHQSKYEVILLKTASIFSCQRVHDFLPTIVVKNTETS